MTPTKYRCHECDNDTFKLVVRGITLAVEDGKPVDLRTRSEIAASSMLDTTWECEDCHTEADA